MGLRRASARRGLGVTRAVRRRQRHRQDDGRRGRSPTSSAWTCIAIDLSQVVSKYIGETEKNLRRVFDAADAAARCCCSTRPTRCSASAARSGTATTATPTSRSATCCSGWRPTAGLAILTTNMQTALDSAFLRRLRFVVEFPFPGRGRAGARSGGASSRRDADRRGLDSARLAQLHRRRRQHPQHRAVRRVPRRRRAASRCGWGTARAPRAASTSSSSGRSSASEIGGWS